MQFRIPGILLAVLIISTSALAQAYVGQFLQTFREFPPRQKPASFSIDQVLEQLQTAGGSKKMQFASR